MNRIVLVIVAMLTVGCASANLTVVRPLASPARQISLEVKSATDAAMTSEQESRLRTLLTSSLGESGVTVKPKSPDIGVFDGEIQRYSPGNRALRYFFGFVGAGRGSFQSTWRVVDSTGQEVGSCRVDGSIVMGAFGGSYDDVLEKVGERLGEFLAGSK